MLFSAIVPYYLKHATRMMWKKITCTARNWHSESKEKEAPRTKLTRSAESFEPGGFGFISEYMKDHIFELRRKI